jgi:hypothetical protein
MVDHRHAAHAIRAGGDFRQIIGNPCGGDHRVRIRRADHPATRQMARMFKRQPPRFAGGGIIAAQLAFHDMEIGAGLLGGAADCQTGITAIIQQQDNRFGGAGLRRQRIQACPQILFLIPHGNGYDRLKFRWHLKRNIETVRTFNETATRFSNLRYLTDDRIF